MVFDVVFVVGMFVECDGFVGCCVFCFIFVVVFVYVCIVFDLGFFG